MEKINEQNTNKLGKIISFLGIILNVLLAVGKIVVGSIFGLISVVADGLNNLTDCGSSVVSLISFKFSEKPADKEHPFGHGRIEYICSLLIAFLMFFVAFETIKESIANVISPIEITFSLWIIIILATSIIVKFALFLCCKIASKKLNSTILSATALDSLLDCVATFVTLVSYIVGTLTNFNADGYAGLFVALFIAWSAFKITQEIISTLIGKAPEQDLINDIKNKILAYDGVLAVHDLSVYNFGPNKYFASAHIEVSAKIDVLVSHELIDTIERDFAENTNVILTGHLDPIETDNPIVNELKTKIEKIVKDIDERFSFHDFRVVIGERNTNILFDIAIPYETKLSKQAIKLLVESAVKNIDESYRVILTIEHQTL